MTVPASTIRIAALELLAASFVVLFQELALIRWLATEIRVLAYFPNLILMSAFLGLGVGCLLVDWRRLLWLWPISMIVVIAVARVMGGIVFTQESTSEHLWLLYYDMPESVPVINNVIIPIFTCFVISALSFVPLGQYVASRIEIFRQHSAALWGYSWDIGGSILGITAFAIVGFVGSPPLVWFGVFMVVGLAFYRNSRAATITYLAIIAGCLAVVHESHRDRVFSPYYAVGLDGSRDHGYDVTVNGSLHQVALGFSEDALKDEDFNRQVFADYRLPYTWLGRTPKRVLILGAGTGNDVFVALHEGVPQIDAVEIDPEILRLGRDIHPNHPYNADRVRVFNTDARAFLNETDERYDLIIFATLDSLTRLSALSNVRLDNFVYTSEAIKLASQRLTDDGGIVLYFMVAKNSIRNRLFGILADALGSPPFVYSNLPLLFNHIFVAGPGYQSMIDTLPDNLMAQYETQIRTLYEPPSDDWPFLYLEKRGVGKFYLQVIALILVFSTILVGAAMWLAGRGSAREPFRVDWELFLFGLGFLLLETRGITAMSLMWGSTWITSAVVFSAVLSMVLGATILTQLRPISYAAGMAGLVLCLVGSYLVPVGDLLSVNPAVKFAWSLVIVGLPVFFASLCFAAVFRQHPRPGVAFGWNILGAVCGGLLEFTSMILGLKALLLIALLAYLLAVLKRHRTALESNA